MRSLRLMHRSRGEQGPKRSNATKLAPLRNIRPCQEVKKKWVSKAELVKEIQDLGASCESKTKEINFAKIQLRKATLGFEALAVLINYVNDEMDPFSQVHLFKEMANTESALKSTGAQLKSYLTQLELINNSHKENVDTVADKLENNHRKEMKKLKRKHSFTLEKTLAHFKEEVTRTKKNIEKKSLERKENIELVLRELNQGLEKHRQEQRNTYAEEIRQLNDCHADVENRLQSQVNSLRSQIELVDRRTKQAEERFYKDKNSKIQRALAKTTELQKETESLKAVLEMKNSQVKDVVDRNAQMKRQLVELNRCREEMMNLEKQTNDVQRILHDKTVLQRELSMQTHNLQLSCEKETKSSRRLILENEELKWRLCESLTKKRASSALFEPRIPIEGKRSLRSGYRSSSLSVLHSSYDENNYLMTTSMPAPTSDGQSKAKCNRMSVSLVSTLPSYEESSSVVTRYTPKRYRSLSVRPSPSKNFKSPNRRLSFRDYINSNPLRFMRTSLKDSLFYVSSPDQDSPAFLKKKNSVSWTIDDMSDYYEDMDDSYLYMSSGGNNDSESSSTNGDQSEASISYKEMESKGDDTNSDSFSVKPENIGGESKRGHKTTERYSRTVVPRSRSLMDKSLMDVYEAQDRDESCTVDFMEEKPFEFLGAGEKTAKEPKRPIGLPRSFSCATSGSLNEKYSTLREKIDRFCHSDLQLNSSSTSSNSSNSMSPEPVISEKKVVSTDLSREFKSADASATSVVPLTSNESVIPETESSSNAVKREKFHRDMMGHIQDDLKLPSAMESSFSSEDAKDRAGNSISFSTTSSQCTAMTDSTNIDISWGDDEFLSDNAK